jgi:hypothetical protein
VFVPLLLATLVAPVRPRAEVTIYRDEFGVPHIYAPTIEAGYFGLGYAQASDLQDRLLMLIARARGELAASRGQTMLGSDVEQRRWRHVEAAEAGFRKLSPELQAAYAQYIAGIKAFLAGHPAIAPAWTRTLAPRDAIVLSRSLLWLGYQAGLGLADCRRGGIKLAAAGSVPHSEPSLASNEWVVAPWRTAAGGTIVLSDPHGEIDGTLFYEYRMHAGPLESAGYALGPLLLLAHTRTLAWGQTTGNPDVADCYEVETDPADSLRYQFDGEWMAMVTTRATFEVKGAAPVTRTMAYTRHNGVLSPVVARVGTKAYVVSSAYMDSLATPAFDEEVFRINLARNVSAAKAAMATMGFYPQNVMFGDAEGNIWYVRAGRAPIHPDGHDWNRPVPGNTSATAWQGIHRLEDLVQVSNPVEGYLVNNNISPDRMLPNPPVTAERYPADLFNDRPGRTNTRQLRAIEVLSRSYALTIAEATELALDEKWFGVERWQRLLAGALATDPAAVAARPPELRRFADAILRFDGQARATSTAALQFLHWQEAMGTGIPAPLLPELDRALDSGSPSAAVTRAVLAGIDSAEAALRRRHPGPAPTLGDEFRIGRDARTWPFGGVSILPKNRPQCAVPIQWDISCLVTLRALTFGPPDSAGQRRGYLGSRALRLVSLTNPIEAYTLHLFGQTTDSTSAHSTDQIPLASERRLKREYFERAELEPHIVSKVTLPLPDAPNR